PRPHRYRNRRAGGMRATMATTFTLDEAADKLGISPEELKKRLQTEWTHIRPMRDRGTILLKVKDVEELARQMGFGSEEELQMADPSSEEQSALPSELKLADDVPARPGPIKSGKQPAVPADDPLILGDKDVFLMADEAKPGAARPPSAKVKAD